jgi:tripartite-type tricarboxylate transporter receptor subunit TctC
VVENRPGANGVVASELLARAAPGGYTIKVMTTGDAINPSLMKLAFDVLKDFAFITQVAESGVPGFAVSNGFGMSAPAKTPPEILMRLHTEIARALKLQDVRARLRNSGAEPPETTLEQYNAFIQNEYTKWAKVIKAAGIKGE